MTDNFERNHRENEPATTEPQVEQLLGSQWFAATDRKVASRATVTAIYARYSPRPDETEESIERQIEACRAYLDSIGAPQPTEERIYIDRMSSGTHLNRPAYKAMLRDLEAGGHTVMAAEFPDRVTRDIAELHRVHKLYEHHGGEIHFAMQGRLQPAMVSVHGFLGVEQRRQLILRTSVGRRMAAAEGRSVGKAAYGYRSVPGSRGVLVVEPTEAEVVRRIFREYAQGASVRSIVIGLNHDRIPSAKGRAWSDAALASRCGLLARTIYVGKVTFGATRWTRDPVTGRATARAVPKQDQIVTGHPELAVVDAATWAAAQQRLAQRGVVSKRSAASTPHLLAGRIFCPCGSRMQYNGFRDKARLACSANSRAGTCARRRTIAAVVIEGDVLRLLRDEGLSGTSSPASRAPKRGRVRETYAKRRAQLERRMVEVEAQLDATMEPETYGLSAERLASLRERLETEIRGIASELERLTVQHTESDRGSRAAVDLGAVIATMLGRLPFEARDANDRELIDTFRSAVDRIEIDLSAKDRSYRIRVSPTAWSGHTKTAGTIERLYDRPRFGFLGDPDRAAAALDAANRELFALADDDWEVVEHLFARRNWRRLEPRRLVDALLFHTWTKVPIICAPPRFGSAVTLNAAMTELVRSGTWANVISLLAEAESPVVAGIDATYFDHWKAEARK